MSEINENGQLKNNIQKLTGVKKVKIPKIIKNIAMNTSEDLIHPVSKDNLPRGSLINLYMRTFHRDKQVDYTKYICLDQSRKMRPHKNLKLPKINLKEIETDILPKKIDIYQNIKANDIIGLSKLKKPIFKY